MVVQSLIVCLDNSKWAINGDFAPSRYACQVEAARTYCANIARKNPENTFGFIALSTKRLLRSFSSNIDDIQSSLEGVRCVGEANVADSLKVACLALNKCSSPNAIKKIFMMVGSEFKMEVLDAMIIKQLLRKRNIHLEIVQFGESESPCTDILKLAIAGHKCGKSENLNHRYFFVPLGSSLKVRSVNLHVQNDGDTSAVNSDTMYEDAPYDEILDPELELALKISREEYLKQTQEEIDDSDNEMDDENLLFLKENFTLEEIQDMEDADRENLIAAFRLSIAPLEVEEQKKSDEKQEEPLEENNDKKDKTEDEKDAL